MLFSDSSGLFLVPASFSQLHSWCRCFNPCVLGRDVQGDVNPTFDLT